MKTEKLVFGIAAPLILASTYFGLFMIFMMLWSISPENIPFHPHWRYFFTFMLICGALGISIAVAFTWKSVFSDKNSDKNSGKNIAADVPIEVQIDGLDTGGDDFVRQLTDRIVVTFKNVYGVDLSRNPIAVKRIRDGAGKARIELASTGVACIRLPFIAMSDDSTRPLHLNMKIKKNQTHE